MHVVEARLGAVIAEAEGAPFYQVVERLRRLMVEFRANSAAAVLDRADRLLAGLTPARRGALARAYTIYLELVNICENAYRTHRLQARGAEAVAGRANVVFVLTAHPTESRSPKNIWLLHEIQALLVDALSRRQAPDTAALDHLLHLVWRVGSFSRTRPAVEDEARHLFSLVSDPIIEELLDLRAQGHIIRLRTWVGGDRDGHPLVGPDQTAAALSVSRRRLLYFARYRVLPAIADDIRLLPDRALERAWTRTLAALPPLEQVRAGDGARLKRLVARVGELRRLYRGRRGHAHPALARLSALLEVFPALVIPLEFREQRGRFGGASAMAAMLTRLRAIARGGRVDWYARGLVVSMATRPEDLLEALALVEKKLGAPLIPIIPLFEMPDVLPRAAEIVAKTYATPAFRRAVRRYRRGRLEVMLGYSDTAKRMGALPSRLALHDAIKDLAAWGRRARVKLVYFQGSGGSEGRGNGTIEDQAAAWPDEAIELVKLTLQGEMVERTLATREIFRSQVLKLARIQGERPPYHAPSAFTRALCREAERAYSRLVNSSELQRLLETATPYPRLEALTIGSRPVSRREGPAFEALRAIPWVLCWTQTRYLVPVWLGVGAAWRLMERTGGAEERLREALAADPLLRSFMRVLSFALAKTKPHIFAQYVRKLAAPGARADWLESEREDAAALARLASGGQLLADRPWLAESIFYRAPMIHPLNLLQIQSLRRRERWPLETELLFRETVTGIAAGMLTTG